MSCEVHVRFCERRGVRLPPATRRFFLRDVLARPSTIDRTRFRAAADGLGRSYRGASTFQTYFAPDRTSDGAAAYRLNKYNDACGCYQYASGLRPLP